MVLSNSRECCVPLLIESAVARVVAQWAMLAALAHHGWFIQQVSCNIFLTKGFFTILLVTTYRLYVVRPLRRCGEQLLAQPIAGMIPFTRLQFGIPILDEDIVELTHLPNPPKAYHYMWILGGSNSTNDPWGNDRSTGFKDTQMEPTEKRVHLPLNNFTKHN